MGKRYRALRRSGNVFDQKDFSKSTKRNPKNNPYKKVSAMNASEEPTSKPKFMRYNTTFSRLLKLILNMSEREQLLLLEYAKSIIDEEDRIYGDGVNIAARLEALADPAGICVSKTAFDQIEIKLPLSYLCYLR